MGVLRHRPLRVKLSLLMVVLLSAGLIVSSFIATAALSGYLIDRVDEAMTLGARPFSEFEPPIGPTNFTQGRLPCACCPCHPRHDVRRHAGPARYR